MKNSISLFLLIMSFTLSANAQECNVDSLQIVLNQKIAEYNSAKKTLDSINSVLNSLIKTFNTESMEEDSISKETQKYWSEINLLSKVYILSLEVNGIRSSLNHTIINDVTIAYLSDQIGISSQEIMNEIIIYDYQGRKLLTNTTNNKQAVIPLPVLGSSSLYIVIITLQNGQKISKKFIYSIN